MALIVVISTISNAASVGMTLSSNSKLKAGDTVTVTMSLGNIDAGNGIDTITAELNYDKNVFETVETSNLIASNSWTPTYASSTNMLTAVKNSKVTKGETVLTITSKVTSFICGTIKPSFSKILWNKTKCPLLEIGIGSLKP